MLYNRLTTEELERRVYVDPDNAEAKAELLSRVPGLIDQEDDDLVDAREQVDEFEKQLESKAEEIDKLEGELGELDEKLADANLKIESLEERIAELTHAEDLV